MGFAFTSSIRSMMSLFPRWPFASLSSPTNLVILFGLPYLILVRALRYRRLRAVNSHFSHLALPDGKLRRDKDGKPLSMTVEEAQRIISPLIHLEMPMLLNYALAFALFKTYAIPGISKILLKTGQLGSQAGVSKRYADTEILISTWMMCPIHGSFNDETSPGLVIPAVETHSEEKNGSDNMVHQVSDPRANLAIARVNYLHGRYKITNDDMLYTLALFILEPPTWARKWGWREFTELESEALFIYWKDVGIRMGISDIPDTLEEIKQWAEGYEKKAMVPAQTNHDLSAYTTSELVYIVPSALGLKRFAERITYALLEPRVRIGMMKPQQPWWMHAILEGLMMVQKYQQRYLCLPRTKPSSVMDHAAPWRGLETLFHPTRFQPTPWYKPVSNGLVRRWMDKALVLLNVHNDVPSVRYSPEGYKLDEQGPLNWREAGREEVLKTADQLLRFGCPLAKS